MPRSPYPARRGMVAATVQGDTATLTGAFTAYDNESYTILIATPPAVQIIME